MSIYVALDSEIGPQIASNRGWSDFIAWAVTLDLTKFYKVVQFAEHGLTEDLAELAENIESAIADGKSPAGVAVIGQNIIDAIRDNPEAGVIMVTNGITMS